VASGKSIVVNISGPGTLVFHTDGSISEHLSGSWLLAFFPGDIPAGPQLYVNTGLANITLTAGGQEILLNQSGTQFDVCGALS
jgi:hypothetical protein